VSALEFVCLFAVLAFFIFVRGVLLKEFVDEIAKGGSFCLGSIEIYPFVHLRLDVPRPLDCRAFAFKRFGCNGKPLTSNLNVPLKIAFIADGCHIASLCQKCAKNSFFKLAQLRKTYFYWVSVGFNCPAGKRVWVYSPPRVRIPPSPPYVPKRHILLVNQRDKNMAFFIFTPYFHPFHPMKLMTISQ